MGEKTTGLDVGGVFSETADLYWGNIGKLFLLSLILVIPAPLLALVGTGSPVAIAITVLSFPLDLVMPVWLAGTIVNLVLDVRAGEGEDRSIAELLKDTWPLFWKLSVLAVVTLIPIFLGFGFLIVPGVILGLMWIVVVPAMVIEGSGAFASMGRSSGLTRYRWGQMVPIGAVIFLGELLLLGLGFLVSNPWLATAIIVVAEAVLYPYMATIITVLYFHLTKSEVPAQPIEQ